MAWKRLGSVQPDIRHQDGRRTRRRLVSRWTPLSGAAAVAIAALALAGCKGSAGPGRMGNSGGMTGSGGGMASGGAMGSGGMMGSGAGGSGVRGETSAPETGPGGGATGGNGAALFASAGCGGCHALSAAGAHGTVGPDLDDTKPGYALVVETVRDGAGAMPSFKGRLTETQIEAIARYVVEATRTR